MFKKLFDRKKDLPPLSMAEKGYVHDPYGPRKPELREIERCFTRLFASEDGQKVLAYLQTITFHRALGPAAPDEQLRYLEGQRSIVASLLRLIERGRKA